MVNLCVVFPRKIAPIGLDKSSQGKNACHCSPFTKYVTSRIEGGSLILDPLGSSINDVTQYLIIFENVKLLITIIIIIII
jgi:hypothetical protein